MHDLILGDCREVLRGWVAGNGSGPRFTAIVTDPPAGIAFMGKEWDKAHGGRDGWISDIAEIARLCLELCLPGAHALVWALPRTSHWTATAWENGGWEVRDRIAHVFGSGFPKSLNIEKNPSFCQCSSSTVRPSCNGGRTGHGQLPDHRTSSDLEVVGAGGCCEASERESSANRQVQDSQVGCPEYFRSCDGLPLDAQGNGQDAEPLQGGARKHNRSRGPSVQTLADIEHGHDHLAHTDHLSRRGYPGRRTEDDYSLVTSKEDDTTVLPVCQVCGKPVIHGYGTALKPAVEDWWLLRKPLCGTVAENVTEWGCGGINVDGCRIQVSDDDQKSQGGRISLAQRRHGITYGEFETNVPQSPSGRFPANLIHDGSDEVVGMFPQTGGDHRQERDASRCKPGVMKMSGEEWRPFHDQPARISTTPSYAEAPSSAARFFYAAKASRAERETGCEGLPEQILGMSNGAQIHGEEYDKGQSIGLNVTHRTTNHHPTVKPLALMRYLLTLVRQPSVNLVLDPFMGSGSTGVAAAQLGIPFVGIEQDAGYFEIARRRIAAAGLPLVDGAGYCAEVD